MARDRDRRQGRRRVGARARARRGGGAHPRARPPARARHRAGGRRPASAIYVRRKHEASEEVGIRSFDHQPDASISQEELLELVGELNDNDEVDGILVQLPLPDHLDPDPVVAALDPGKDVDGLTPTSAGLLARGQPGLRACHAPGRDGADFAQREWSSTARRP